ncbi:MAG: HNH endonuclease domain-containing protein [Flavobacteriia bacterium]|jgi:hypothetical protein
MRLPQDQNVNVSLLSSVFRNTVATYKYYWFLSIIECVEEGKDEIEKRELFARMIVNAWYTVNYFRISFGKQDKIQEAVERIKALEGCALDEKKQILLNTLLTSSNKEIVKQLKHFNANVPYKFLSPWLGTHSEKEMYLMSQENYNLPPYALYPDRILVQPAWMDYFRKNSGLIKDFCFWNLTLFLQTRNPNVPNIPSKLIRPEKRGSLVKHKKDFWDIVLEKTGPVKCIYTNKSLKIGEYAVEHFIPFQFVSHDLMWNLIPADGSFNSSKSDKLPILDDYFDDFYALQQEAVKIVQFKEPKNKFLEDYLTLFHDLNLSKDRYREQIEPLITIAHNNGFQFMKAK